MQIKKRDTRNTVSRYRYPHHLKTLTCHSKQCRTCGGVFPIDFYYKTKNHSVKKIKIYPDCKHCHNERNYLKNNPDKCSQDYIDTLHYAALACNLWLTRDKYCPECDTVKSIWEFQYNMDFPPNNDSLPGHWRYECKKCQHEKRRQYYHKQKESYRKPTATEKPVPTPINSILNKVFK